MAVGFPVKANYATGDVLTAANMNDLAGTVNLAVGTTPSTGTQMAGKNKIINGDFYVNQRAFTTTSTTGTFGFDRWAAQLSGGTATYSAQTFTAGTAPVAGYEGTNFARLATTVGNDYCSLRQRIEDVRTFAGQTMTLSFWAKGTNPTTLGGLFPFITQVFGTGGSTAVVVESATKVVLTADWTRYSITFAVPSVSGKTIGAGSCLEIAIGQGTNTSTESWTLDLWGVQVEAGSIATPFQTATGTLQGELAACQRYYYRGVNNGAYTFYGSGGATSTTAVEIIFPLPVTMRIQPSTVDFSTLAVQPIGGGTITAITTVTSAAGTQSATLLQLSGATSLTSGAAYRLVTNNSTSGFLGLSAEL